MSPKLTLSLLLVVLLSLSAVTVANAQMTGVVGGGIGTVDNVGTPLSATSTFSAQLFTINGIVILFPTPLWAFVGDISLGLEHTYKGFDGNDTEEVEISAIFVDVLGAVHKKIATDGFFYFGAGLTLATADATTTEIGPGNFEVFESDFDTSIGLVFGAGAGLPITNKLLGFINIRERFVTTETTITSNQSGLVAVGDVSIGGFEMSAGVGVEF